MKDIFIIIIQKKIQEFFKIDFDNLENSKLHPEWPTSKKATEIHFSKYRKNNEKNYIVDVERGCPGFIDFAIGKYMEPEFAIEFTSKDSFASKDLFFDFLKLLDSKNPFKYTISFNLIYREKGLPKNKQEEEFFKKLEKIRTEIKGRTLEIAENRSFLFWIIEVDKNEKRSWVCEDINCSFKRKIT